MLLLSACLIVIATAALVSIAVAASGRSGISGGDKITTFAGTTKFGFGGFFGDRGPASKALLANPKDLAVDGRGNIYVADTGNQRVRKISTNGTITTIVGGGPGIDLPGLATSAIIEPQAVAVDAQGNVYASDYRVVFRITPGGTMSILRVPTSLAFRGTAAQRP